MLEWEALQPPPFSPLQQTAKNGECIEIHVGREIEGLGRGAGCNDNLVGMILSLRFHFLQLHRFALSAWMKVNLQETSHLFYFQLTFP